jgi:8-amino-3,8-dideoxy-alpha-D-manno-octulosonate transaminase
MNELQGAIGLAQLARLDKLFERQKQNQNLIRTTLERFDKIRMRALPEGGTDSYTHVAFFLENRDEAMAFHKRLTEKGVPAVYFKSNFWHYLPNWEHLIQRRTMWPGPFPFGGPVYGREAKYTPDMLPVSDRILERLIVMPVFLNTDEERIQTIANELESAAEQLL